MQELRGHLKGGRKPRCICIMLYYYMSPASLSPCCRFSMATLMPRRWFSIGSPSRFLLASFESDLRRGRMALRCASSFTAVRSRVRRMMLSFCRFFRLLFFRSRGTRSCENAAVVLPSFAPVIYWFLHRVKRWVTGTITQTHISCKRTATYERIFLSFCIYII